MSQARILLVDDEPAIVETVRAYLEAEGYTVQTASDGPGALTLARSFHPDIIVLDLMLPGLDGLEVLRRLRQVSDVYVLLLTAKTHETDKVVGLTMVADDYVTKPFSPRELVARVKALLRRGRSSGASDAALVFHRLRLDPQARLEIHELMQNLRREQRTILLTTHYIEEAEKLCDRVAIIDEGLIIAMGTPREIQERTLGTSTIEMECRPCPSAEQVPAWNDVEKVSVNGERGRIAVTSRRAARTIVDMVEWLRANGIELVDIDIHRPTLEEAFIELTGKSLRE